MPVILVAIGANLSDAHGRFPLFTCRAAVDDLAGLDGLRLVATSRWYATAPIPAADQPDYVNGVALLRGAADPAVLLERLHRIEARAGRRRSGANAARPLDLDIIAIDSLVRDAPDPVLPHPRAHLRAFVLRPLLDIWPDWIHPALRVSGAALLDRLGPQEIRPL